MRFRMGPLEIGIILVIVLIIFGVGKLPQVGESLGKGLRAFRQGQQEDDDKKKENVEAAKAETTTEAPAAEAQAEEPKAEAPKTEAKETPPAKIEDED
jgi:sec-independent protein translocase protein TatA